MQNKAVGTGLKLADDMPTGHPSRGPSCFGSGALDSSSCHQGSPALRHHGDKLPCLHTSHKPLRAPRPQKHNGLVITRPPLCIQGKPQPLSTHPELVASFSSSVAERKRKTLPKEQNQRTTDNLPQKAVWCEAFCGIESLAVLRPTNSWCSPQHSRAHGPQ